ncbi:phosphoprotein [Durham virus]|uniref:Phosphoprotein n=1 Tax=Durham virus TaxID=710545 RepID=D6C4E4_9RHAB|nr:phosphoprotein [Durham virus]ADB88759.1 phosphoprotein [Durham virus]
MSEQIRKVDLTKGHYDLSKLVDICQEFERGMDEDTGGLGGDLSGEVGAGLGSISDRSGASDHSSGLFSRNEGTVSIVCEEVVSDDDNTGLGGGDQVSDTINLGFDKLNIEPNQPSSQTGRTRPDCYRAGCPKQISGRIDGASLPGNISAGIVLDYAAIAQCSVEDHLKLMFHQLFQQIGEVVGWKIDTYQDTILFITPGTTKTNTCHHDAGPVIKTEATPVPAKVEQPSSSPTKAATTPVQQNNPPSQSNKGPDHQTQHRPLDKEDAWGHWRSKLVSGIELKDNHSGKSVVIDRDTFGFEDLEMDEFQWDPSMSIEEITVKALDHLGLLDYIKLCLD